MKKLLILLLAATLLTACGRDGRKDVQILQTQTAAPTLHRMSDYHVTDTLRVGSRVYLATLHREAKDSLGIVEDENGERYVDNFYRLTILRDEATFFDRRFTKKDFASLLNADFRRNGILDGFRFRNSQDGKLFFSVCVSYPESDMTTPFVLAIGPDGSYTIEADNALDMGDMGEDEGV